jgi:uncharacterized coiled-coil DUF342 family protein
MTTDERQEIDERLDHLELKIDRLADVVGRLAEDIDSVTMLRESIEAAVAEIKADTQRGFGDLRNAIRHFSARISEADRCRLR